MAVQHSLFLDFDVCDNCYDDDGFDDDDRQVMLSYDSSSAALNEHRLLLGAHAVYFGLLQVFQLHCYCRFLFRLVYCNS